jgi:hypothetical protein
MSSHNQQNNKDQQSPRIMVSGGIFPNVEYDRLADITPQDLENIVKDWEENAPKEYKNLLNAD